MLCNCITKNDYDSLSEDIGNYPLCVEEHCTTCLVNELKKQKWDNQKVTNEHDFLKIAYEKSIIKAFPSSIKELSKEDKKKIKMFLTLCHLRDYEIW